MFSGTTLFLGFEVDNSEASTPVVRDTSRSTTASKNTAKHSTGQSASYTKEEGGSNEAADGEEHEEIG